MLIVLRLRGFYFGISLFCDAVVVAGREVLSWELLLHDSGYQMELFEFNEVSLGPVDFPATRKNLPSTKKSMLKCLAITLTIVILSIFNFQDISTIVFLFLRTVKQLRPLREL